MARSVTLNFVVSFMYVSIETIAFWMRPQLTEFLLVKASSHIKIGGNKLDKAK